MEGTNRSASVSVVNKVNLVFREGNIDDIEDVFLLNRAVFDESWSKDMMLQSLLVGYDLYVCYQEKRLLGYLLSQDILYETQVMQLAVDQGYRRMGIANKLLQMLMDEKNDMDVLMLEVRASNLGAQLFYAKLGFVEVGRRPNYYTKTSTKPREEAAMFAFVICAFINRFIIFIFFPLHLLPV